MTTALPHIQDLLNINPLAVQGYLKSTGWTATKSRRNNLMFFATERGGHEFGITLPLSSDFRDYTDALYMVVEQLAEVERRPIAEVITMFNSPVADVLRFRRIDSATENGTLPLDDGPRLLKNIRKALYTVVCDELQPTIYHKRLYSPVAEDFVRQCSLGQTERGSYIATVICPFTSLDKSEISNQLSLFNDSIEFGSTPDYADSFTRRVTVRFMRSLSRIFQAIETNQLDALQETDASGELVSSNLMEAILNLNNEKKEAGIEISTQWASIAPLAQVEVPQSVKFVHQHFIPLEKAIERIQTRTPNSLKVSEFVGRVSLLQAEPDIDQRTNGQIVLNTFDLDGKVIKPRLVVSPDEFDLAILAMKQGLNVRVKGILTTKGRTKHLEYTSISLLDELAETGLLPM